MLYFNAYLVKNLKIKCHYECLVSGLPCGPTAEDCQECAHLSYVNEYAKKKCVSYCPSGMFADYDAKKCLKCHPSCSDCSGPSNMNCTHCLSGYVFNPDSNQCSQTCPTGYFKSTILL